MDFDTAMPIYLQVIHEMKQKIVRGTLPLGSRLPSARELAVSYQINPNTANRIYREMEAEELCYTKRGLGTFVTEDEKKVAEIRKEMAEELLCNFLKGMIELGFQQEELLLMIQTEYNKKKRAESGIEP